MSGRGIGIGRKKCPTTSKSFYVKPVNHDTNKIETPLFESYHRGLRDEVSQDTNWDDLEHINLDEDDDSPTAFNTPQKSQSDSKRKAESLTISKPSKKSKSVMSSAITSSVASTKENCQWKDCNEIENQLRHFDLDLKYGPCIGITRLQRYQRAEKFGLNPLKKVLDLIESVPPPERLCILERRLAGKA